MQELAEKLKFEGKKAYTLPMGGSCSESMWAYIDCWAEMESQHEYFDEITDVVAVYGSGGTVLDLALGNYWSGMKKRVHGVSILKPSGEFSNWGAVEKGTPYSNQMLSISN